jgi:hypothetical protein
MRKATRASISRATGRAPIESDITCSQPRPPLAGVGRGHAWKVQCRMLQSPDNQPEQTAKKAAVLSLEVFLAGAILVAAVAFLVMA